MDLPVIYQQNDQIAQVTLNRPDKFNCINHALLDGLLNAIETAEQTNEVRVLVLDASGKHFCTGADLEEVTTYTDSEKRLDAFIGHGHNVMQRIESSPIPVIAAIHGYCLAGGMELMMCADMVFASTDARVGCQHARYGLVPGWGGTQRLPRLVGLRRALELMYSARWLNAEVSQQWGLVNTVVSNNTASAAALEFAEDLAQKSPDGLAAMKQLSRAGATLPLHDALLLEQGVAVPALMSANVSEGLSAFRERREPEFQDRNT